MDSNVMDFHILTTLGAVFFALSFIRGRQGRLGASLCMAALAALMGIVAAIDGGALARPGFEPVFVIVANFVLPLLSVLVSRKFYMSGQRSQ